jgi:3-dehydroquinate dehydratase II
MKIFVLNGPNLNLLGSRDPEVYGSATLEDVESSCQKLAGDLGFEIDFRQTNHEGEMIDWLHEAKSEGSSVGGIVLNPAALTHYSWALREAVAACELPVIEVHISNIYAREQWRARSVVSAAARAVIAGAGVEGYELAITALAGMIDPKSTKS